MINNKKYNVIAIIIIAFFAINQIVDAFMDYQIHQQLRQSDLELHQEILDVQQTTLETQKSQNQILESLGNSLEILCDQLVH